MINVKSNFKNQFSNDILCELCKSEDDTQEHLISCKTLFTVENLSVNYEDIFGNDHKKQEKIGTILANLLEKRKKIYDILNLVQN